MTEFKDEVKGEVLNMYMHHPYPNYSAEERQQIFPAELCRYRYLGLEQALKGAVVLDVGCGTGHRVLPLMKHFGVKTYIGIDHSAASLEIARSLAEELELSDSKFFEGDLFNLPFDDGSIDVVISQGVLHHTSRPHDGFLELVRVCKPGGLVNIYLYNKWNHWRHNLQKNKVSRLAGTDVRRRFEVAHELYGVKPVENMTPSEIAGFYDQYCHPHKSDHVPGETLGWYCASGLDYWGSYPPLGVRDFVSTAQYRSSIAGDDTETQTQLSSMVLKAASVFPTMSPRTPPYRFPTVCHRGFWQLIYAIQGRSGAYSGGAALCGRKQS
jgi:ubiquinone/menaquinone biosynthesis C-methylase UbiE